MRDKEDAIGVFAFLRWAPDKPEHAVCVRVHACTVLRDGIINKAVQKRLEDGLSHHFVLQLPAVEGQTLCIYTHTHTSHGTACVCIQQTVEMDQMKF